MATAQTRAGRRIVVCVLGEMRGTLDLPRSQVVDDHPGVTGGERSLYEIATAAAAVAG